MGYVLRGRGHIAKTAPTRSGWETVFTHRLFPKFRENEK